METMKVIEERRSIRSFKNEEISKDVVEDILNCGRLAPSAKNRQPWYFVVLRNEMKDKVADLMIEYKKNALKSEERTNGNVSSSLFSTANVIKQAPIFILIFRPKEDNWITGDNLSIGACVENMCLRATDLGLGSLWIRDIVFVSKKVAEMLGHEDLELNCALLLGKSSQNPKQRPRKELKDITEWLD